MTTATSNPTAPVIVHKYTLKRWDLLRTQAHGLSRNRVLIAFFIILSTFTAFLDLREPEMAARSLAFKVFFIIVFDAVFITIISLFTLVVVWLMILIRRNRGVLGEHTLEVTPSGLVERTEFNETIRRWQGFHKVVRTRQYLYLWVNESMVHTVPIRSFASEDAARLFQHEIETHRKAA
jgi:hypothetical protein